ncbi:hypothetical protein CC77DRAFT_1024475 [Alternaria alternata]|uniref:Uncharacterized protein n=1 Tax=Alternaria alternata TaxID=5599 RepID=A0A177D999_ALTAL|nr:hypothetical protein CC77DRAFT_1024475 [Alternaria alternata]OAG16048.1 hypothetical protein CC77DRAFT_1024475 [Alternaria alternata]
MTCPGAQERVLGLVSVACLLIRAKCKQSTDRIEEMSWESNKPHPYRGTSWAAAFRYLCFLPALSLLVLFFVLSIP